MKIAIYVTQEQLSLLYESNKLDKLLWKEHNKIVRTYLSDTLTYALEDYFKKLNKEINK